VDESCGRVVPKGDTEALIKAIRQERELPKQSENCLKRAERYEKYGRFQEYVELYHRLAGQGE